MAGETLAERRVVALNSSQSSENRIHADDVARRYGFRGGLVPGVTVYGYLAALLAETLGEEWVSAGRTAVRFRSPCYEGDELILRLSSDGAVEVRAGDERRVTGDVSVPAPAGSPSRVAAVDSARTGARVPSIPPASPPEPGRRPVVSSDGLAAGTVLGSVPLDTDADALVAYEERIGELPAVLAHHGWVHPGMLLDAANRVLMANLVMPLWLHVGSDIGHLRPVTVGEPVEVRARVVREWEQKGHRFVTLDVEWVAGLPGPAPSRAAGLGPDGELVATATHTAIWQLAGT